MLFAHIDLYFDNAIRLFNRNHMRRLLSFNLYLLAVLCFGWAGCRTAEKKDKRSEEASTIRLHLEVNADGTPYNTQVPVYRERPYLVNVEKRAFLTELDLVEAAVVEEAGGFLIRLQFDPHGTLVLRNVTTASKGKRVAVYSEFGQARWLAAQVIQRNVTTGTFIFTPDATREEAERIVRGLNNLVAAIKKRSRF